MANRIPAASETVSVPEAERRLNVSKSHIYGCARRGELPFPFLGIGKRVVIPAAALNEFLTQRTGTTQDRTRTKRTNAFSRRHVAG